MWDVIGAVFWFGLALGRLGWLLARPPGGIATWLTLLLAVNSLMAGVGILWRRPARRTGSAVAHAVAYLSTVLPLALQPGRASVGLAFSLVGTAFGLWAAAALVRAGAFGIAPADRGLVTGGPYRWLRHPLYLAAIVAALGVVWGRWTVWNLAVLGLLTWALVWRARAEERVLAGYPAYARRVRWRMLPPVWVLLAAAILWPGAARAQGVSAETCAPRFDGRVWRFTGVVVERARLEFGPRTLELVRVACGGASVWVAPPEGAAPVGAEVDVFSPEFVPAGPQGVDWAACDLAYCEVAQAYAATTVWSEADFLREGRGPWYPWGVLFWQVEVVTLQPKHMTKQTRVTMRRFVLYRHEDVSGVSGTGLVAEGVRFSDGTVVLHWLRAPYQTGLFPGIGDLLAVHGHGGRTELRWLDDPLRSEDGNGRGALDGE